MVQESICEAFGTLFCPGPSPCHPTQMTAPRMKTSMPASTTIRSVIVSISAASIRDRNGSVTIKSPHILKMI